MPPVAPPRRSTFIFRIFGWFTYIMSIIAFLISLPFIIFVGLGLIATVPLFLFIKVHRQYMRAIKLNLPLPPTQYKSYFYFTLASGLASAFGCFLIWDISDGVTGANPRAPAPFFMAFLGAPIITAVILFAVSQWNARFNELP
jgi:hypothetical protein